MDWIEKVKIRIKRKNEILSRLKNYTCFYGIY